MIKVKNKIKLILKPLKLTNKYIFNNKGLK